MPKESLKIYSIETDGGQVFAGTAEEVIGQLRAEDWHHADDDKPDADRRYQETVARRVHIQTGKAVPLDDPDAFVEGLAAAGILTITKREGIE